jgi:hypothetical protein
VADEPAPKPGNHDVGGVRALPALSRGERLALADVIVHWATAVEGLRAVADAWAESIQHLRRAGASVTELELDRKIAEGLNTIRQMQATEKMSKETRQYLRNVLGAAANVEFDK